MELKDGHLKGAAQQQWLCMKVKVALAVAIIKNKPSGLSSRQHAEALARKLMSGHEGWKEKSRELQQEVLRLRQELLMTTVTSKTKSSAEATGRDETMDLSQDLFGPECAAYSAELQPGTDSETPELLQQDHQPEPPEPPGPSGPSGPSGPAGLQGGPLGSTVQFLQSLCSLRRVGLEALWFHPEGDAVLMDSVCQLLDSVVVACRDPPPLGPPDLVLQACQVAARAIDAFRSERRPSVEFRRRVEESLTALTGQLLTRDHPSTPRAAEELTERLVSLGSSSMCRSFLIRHILAQISSLTDQLWQAFQGQENSGLDRFPLDQYQSSCHLLWILEKLLQMSQVAWRVEAGLEQPGFLSHLEQHVFALSSEFPLFSIYLWRIRALLTSSDSS